MNELAADGIAVTVTCRVLGIARQPYYRWLKKPVTDAELAEADFSRARVRLNRRPWNTNYVGTAFGGSLFSMSDPFWMFLLMRRLGSDYVVWDVAGEIDFVSPGRTAVHGEFEVNEDQVAEIRDAAAGGEKVLRWFSAELTDDAGEVVARVRKQIYVRRKREAAARDSDRTASDSRTATTHTAAPPHHA